MVKVRKIFPLKCKCDRILSANRYRNEEWMCEFCYENIPIGDKKREKEYLEWKKMLLTFPIPKK